MFRNRVDCYSEAEGWEVIAQCEAEGFVAELFYWGSCHWEVQYWKQEITA